MVSARKKAAETMEWTDVIIEVLDARLPEASCNPMIKELRLHRQRPCLKILNKADLADPAATQAWINFYNRQKDVKAVALSCKKPGDVAKVPGLCQALAPHRGTNLKPLRMMIMGIPNVGKSTLMNALLKRRVAAVGDEPAVTKNQQRFELNDRMSITDTPGLMWPKIEHDSDGYMLAASHAIGRNAVIDEEVAAFLANILLARYPALLTARYGLRRGRAGCAGRHRSRRPKARLSPQGRRAGSGKSLARLADGLPHRRTGPHQPGDAGNPQRHARRAGFFGRRKKGTGIRHHSLKHFRNRTLHLHE